MAGERQEFMLPSVDEGATRATVVRWLVELGDRVLVDRPICLVDVGADGTERLLELTSPFAGTVAALGAGTGDALGVGDMLLTVSNDGIEQHSPLVRRLADEFDVDLAALVGTGPGGRITRSDVHRAAFPDQPLPGTTAEPDPTTQADTTDDRAPEAAPTPEPALTPKEAPNEGPETPAAAGPGDEPSPPGSTLAVSVTAEAGQLLRAHERLADSQDGPVAIDALLVRIAEIAIRDLPRLASTDGPAAIGFARLTDNRMVDATVSAPHDLTLVELDRRMHELTLAAQHGEADAGPPAAVTIVDAGALGMTSMTPLITPGAVATIAFGRPEPRPAMVDGAVRNGWTLTATGAFDPGSVDVALASLLLRRIRLYVEDPILAFAT